MEGPRGRDQADGKLTPEAADQMADAFVQGIRALAEGDQEGKDAEVAKMRHILDNPKGRT